MKNSKFAAFTLIAVLTAVPLSSYADNGLYLGASVGSATLTETFDGVGIDADSTAYRLTLGMQLNDFLGVEGGYQSFGRFTDSVIIGNQVFNTRLQADGFTLGVTGSIPLGRNVSLFGRAGAFFWDGDARLDNFTRSRPEDTNSYLGGGATVAFSESLELVGDWTRYQLENTESDVISLGFIFRF